MRILTPRTARPALIALALLVLPGLASAAPPGDPFRERGVEGAFVLLDTASGKQTVHNRRIAERRFVPCSTFKIPNTLIGLETGAIPDERFALPWDHVDRSRPEWNRDHDLASAMKLSVVWFYQEVARRIGKQRMARWVRDLRYGNRDVSGVIDRFWLDGPLAISALEQVDFLRRLHAGALPVSAEHAVLVLRLIELERGDGWVLRGKTGLGRHGGRPVGWLVGSVTAQGHTWIYALVLRGSTFDALMPMRRELAEQLLRSYRVLPPRPTPAASDR